MSCNTRLNKAFVGVPVLPLSRTSKYVIISDCHRGTGNSNDNFLKNQHLYFAALQYYYCRNYTYIELGDGDELWENRSMKDIIEVHSNVFWLLSEFYKRNRLYMVYGNHDMVKKYKKYDEKQFSTYFCSSSQCTQPLFPDINFYSGIILREPLSGYDLYLTHGHQADFMNSVMWKLNRFLVRYIWKPLESAGVNDPTNAAKNNRKRNKVEKRLIRWAEHEHHSVITGHTHRPFLDEGDVLLKAYSGDSDISYYNSGSCVHPRCVTCLEIDGLNISLVKWCMASRADYSLYVSREVLAHRPLF